MALSQLSLTDFRNLKSSTLDFHRSINLISGNNGSGKTSLLEAIHVLCQACSFRTHHLKQCTAHDKSSFLLFGRFGDYKAGLSKSAQKLEIKINGEAVRKRSELVSKTPVKVVNADSFNLISGPPEERRRYLNWCLFHVEHDYSDHWLGFNHALRQRNRLLKTRQDLNLLDYWNDYLIEPALAIQQFRETYTQQINRQLKELLPTLAEKIRIEIGYTAGWPQDLDFKQCLLDNRDRDIRAGFTQYGIHRDNLFISADGLPAAQVLSRGQTKLVCLALILAVLNIVRENSDREIILLVDDLRSELDEESQNSVYRQLHELGLQLFITNIETSLPSLFAGKELKLFHVEHGIIKALKKR